MRRPALAPIEAARLHTMLRFALGTTSAFAISESAGWYPTFLPAILAAVLLANIPGALPFKAGLFLVIVQSVGAYAAYGVTALLHNMPLVLFGTIGLILFICLAFIAQGRGFLPLLLVLVSFATIPVVTMVSPQEAVALPQAFMRGMVIAVVTIWIAFALLPKTVSKPPPPASPAAATPIATALTGTAIILPIMLVYLMYAITDALPVLITTMVLVVNLDPRRSAMQGLAMMIGNFIGGMVAILAYSMIHMAPSLVILALVVFLIALLFAVRVERGGAAGTVALITFNQAIVMLGLALMPGGSSAGLWATRLVQFGSACLFAIGMMALLLPRVARRI